MENIQKDELFNISVNMLKFAAETGRQTTVKLILFRIFNCGVLTLTLSYIILNFFRVTDEFYVKTLQASISISHLILKYLLLMYYKSDIEELLLNIKQKFWDYRKFTKDVRENIERITRIVKYIQVAIVTVLFLTVSMYFLRPVFTSFSFLIETATPKSDAIAAILLMSQFYCFFLGVPVIFSYDLIYLAICVRISLQVKLLKQKLKEILNCNGNTEFEMKKCIEYHQFLLTIFSRAKHIYSVMLLFHYFVTLITACSDLFELLIINKDLSDSLIKFASVILFIGQFAYYAIPAEEVAFEFSDIPNAVYMSNWYSNDISVQKTVLYIMTNSLHVNYFSGAGIMNINVDAFGSVVRKTFSFYTLLRNLLIK